MSNSYEVRSPLLVLLLAAVANAQDLVPRAYMITPVGSNALTLSFIWNNGDLVFDPTAPIDNGKGRFGAQVLSVYHAYSLLGRSSNVVVSLPYAVGNFSGDVFATNLKVYRSGMVDARVRFSVNLRGGPAMRLKEFRQWREKSLVGASLTVVFPTGQYDPARAINPGTNRWALKPELGISRRWGRVVTETYAGAWLFSTNREYFPGTSVRSQRPMAAVEAHIAYNWKPGLWASFDGNFWAGGRSTIDGIRKQDLQKNSRGGMTFSSPISRHQSMKFSYSRGTYVNIGGDFQSISLGWQYSWLGKPG